MRGRGRVVAILAVGALAGAPMAAAHTDLVQTSPSDGARLDVAPQVVALRFGDPIASVDSVSVTGPSGAELERDVRLDPGDAARVLVNVDPDGAGTYRVDWSIVSADGDTVGGAYTYAAARGSLSLALNAIGDGLRSAAAALRAAGRRA